MKSQINAVCFWLEMSGFCMYWFLGPGCRNVVLCTQLHPICDESQNRTNISFVLKSHFVFEPRDAHPPYSCICPPLSFVTRYLELPNLQRHQITSINVQGQLSTSRNSKRCSGCCKCLTTSGLLASTQGMYKRMEVNLSSSAPA